MQLCSNRFRQPLTLIVATTLSFIGLFIAFYTSQTSFDQGGYASFFLVTGVVSLPVLMLINEFNLQIKKEGDCDPVRSYVKATHTAMRPIIYFLTTALSGLMPFLWIGSIQPFWYSLTVGTVGGIIASLVVILFLYQYFYLIITQSEQ